MNTKRLTVSEEKQILIKDLCARLPYRVKILHTGWDSDRDTDFDTVETLIGIDNRFIYTVWDKTSDIEKHCLSVSNWKPYLRPMSSMTEEEEQYVLDTWSEESLNNGIDLMYDNCMELGYAPDFIDWLNEHHFDYHGLIHIGLALEAPEEMYKTE